VCAVPAVVLRFWSPRKTFRSGAQGELKANFDSARFRGAISKTIYLYSNDPVRPTMQFHLKGNVLEIVAVEPAQINFGRVEAANLVTTKVVLRNQGKETLTLEIGRAHV